MWGSFLYENMDECIKMIESVMKYDRKKREEIREKNKLLYNEYFTPRKFAKNYVKMLKEIL